MVLVFQEEESGEIIFYLKGADVVMQPIVRYNDWLEEEVRSLLFISLENVEQSDCHCSQKRVMEKKAHTIVKYKYFSVKEDRTLGTFLADMILMSDKWTDSQG